MENPWFQIYNPSVPAAQIAGPRMRLYCFHHAGASCQYFQPWANKLPTWIQLVAVQLPGRWNRMQEPAFVRMAQLIPVIGKIFQDELAQCANQPYAFYGHSLGGLVAYELTRFLMTQQQQLPAHIFISSRRAASLPSSAVAIYQLPSAQFEQAIKELYGGLPLEITADPDMRKLFLDITNT